MSVSSRKQEAPRRPRGGEGDATFVGVECEQEYRSGGDGPNTGDVGGCVLELFVEAESLSGCVAAVEGGDGIVGAALGPVVVEADSAGPGECDGNEQNDTGKLFHVCL